METHERLKQLERDEAAARSTIAVAYARIDGIRSERKRLEAILAGGQYLADLNRTDAIVEVLRRANVPLSPQEVWEGLIGAGRADEYRQVTATLSYLLKSGSVQRPSGGRYTSA